MGRYFNALRSLVLLLFELFDLATRIDYISVMRSCTPIRIIFINFLLSWQERLNRQFGMNRKFRVQKIPLFLFDVYGEKEGPAEKY